VPFAAALSTAAETAPALAEVCDQALAKLGNVPQLAVAFFTPHHAAAAAALADDLRRSLRPSCLLGCLAEAVIGNEREVEEGPGLVLWLARWKGAVDLQPFELTLENTADGPSLLGWPDALSGADPARSAVLLLGDPFTFPTDLFLQQVNDQVPGVRVLGGMASGVRGPGRCRLLGPSGVSERGAVGVLLQDSFGLRSVVSQGCRPVGRHLVITRAEDNVIFELGGKPPLQHLKELWPTLSPEEQDLLRQGLHVGRVINEYRGDFQRGDFLVRNVIGLDRSTGAMAITDRVRVGQTVQFHVRDARTADEDLHALLQMDQSAHDRAAAAALLFSCNGRGTRLFGAPHHDATALRAEAGRIPVAGFFAQGELGPVGGQNFIHGFTASVALFEDT
jgi:small ligand-binding sensory domain FIST